MKILITGHTGFHNKGCQALILTTTKILKQAFPEASFTVFSWEPEYDQKHFYNDLIECRFFEHRFQVGEFSRRNRFWFFLNYYLGVSTDRILWVKPSFYEAIKTCDLLVVSGGDVLADYGDESIKHCFFPIAVAIALKKPVYVFAQSISPYKSNAILKFARFFLNKLSLITVRERLSLEYLKNIGIKAPLHLTADPAFTLMPCSSSRLNEIIQAEHLPNANSTMIGISVSETATRWSDSSHEDFAKIMAEVCDQLINKYKAKIVFIPHVSYPDDPANDDRVAGRAVRSLMVNKQDAFLIEGDYSCEELKAVIGKCALFIGARTHATIAAASMLVPTIAVAYSIKAFGIMEDILDKEKCVCDIRSTSRERLLSKAEYLMDNSENVVKEMRKRLEKIREQSMRNGELAREIIKVG
ncbi:MAG: polysaccharide pyruvyl transferase family protein [Deltaproteobacteria bacterium]|nr:polysaccharide pyruvyl transferase family protein [Deltaproteobacteria bacterium]